MDNTKEYLTIKEISEELNMKRQFIYNNLKRIPDDYINSPDGYHIRFNKKDINKIRDILILASGNAYSNIEDINSSISLQRHNKIVRSLNTEYLKEIQQLKKKIKSYEKQLERVKSN